MNTPTVIPYLPLPSEQIRGLVAAQRFDADVFESHGALNAFVRLPIDEELNDAPDALRLTLELPPMEPFRHIVKVSRADAGGLFPIRREVLQVRMADGFDPSRTGTLRGGFLTNTSTDREPESKSPGELSAMLYGPRAT